MKCIHCKMLRSKGKFPIVQCMLRGVPTKLDLIMSWGNRWTLYPSLITNLFRKAQTSILICLILYNDILLRCVYLILCMNAANFSCGLLTKLKCCRQHRQYSIVTGDQNLSKNMSRQLRDNEFNEELHRGKWEERMVQVYVGQWPRRQRQNALF